MKRFVYFLIYSDKQNVRQHHVDSYSGWEMTVRMAMILVFNELDI